MSFSPSNGAIQIATQAGNNLAADGYPNLQTSIAAGNTAPAAYVDGILSGLGYQSQFTGTCGNVTTTSGSFVASGFPQQTITFPLAKTYVLRCTIAGYQTSTLSFIFWQALFNKTGQSQIAVNTTAMRTYPNVANQVAWGVFDVVVTLPVAGAWTLDFYFHCNGGGDNANTNGNCAFSVTVMG